MDIVRKFYITNKHKVATILNDIPITDVLQKYYNVKIDKYWGNISIPCPIHGGKNKNFTVYIKTNTCHCFSKCVRTYNPISLAYHHYHTNDFNYAAIKLALDFNVDIKEYLAVKGDENV